MLRQKITCDGDVNMITYNWVKGYYAPHPNFNVVHQCRDFESIAKYAYDHRIVSPLFTKGYFTRPTDESFVEFDEPPVDPTADE